MIYTYLAISKKDNSYYVGISNNPRKRIKDHNSGKLKTTARQRPWEIVYWREHTDYNEARKHEKWLKKKGRTYKDKLAQLAPPGWAG